MTTFQTIKRFFSPLRGDRKFLTKAIIWFCLWGVDGVFIAYIVKSITVKIQSGDMSAFHSDLMFFAFGMIVFHLLAYIMFRWGYIDYRVKENLNRELLPSFFHIENNFYETIGTGRSLSIVQKGIETWANLLHEIMTFIPMSVISLAMSVYIIFTINPAFLFAFFISLSIVGYLIHIVQGKGLSYRKLKVELESEYTRHFIRNIMSKFEILQSDKIQMEVEGLNGKLQAILDMDKKKHTFEHLTYNIGNVTTNVVRGLLLLFIGTRIITGVANYSDLILAITVVGYFETSLGYITNIYKKILKSFSNIEKLWEFVDESPKMNNIGSGKEFTYDTGTIRIDNVSFGYHAGASVFKNLTLEIAGGTKTAFVGESGGGKTTLIKLLSGYITPNEGEILIDGHKLSETKLTDYYKHIGYLTQDPGVFDGTIYENLAYALQYPPTVDQLETVLRSAKCEFVLEFEAGLETEIGERGVRLSGGQKQRLAIAKIMLKDPDIIFLDEPTSALDSFNEEQVNIALSNLFTGRTVIVVAHRLQTVKTAKRILYFENGRIVEDGTHEELVRLNGRYAKMLELQSGF